MTSAASFIASAVEPCFAHCDPTRVGLKCEIVGHVFSQSTVADLGTMHYAHVLRLLVDRLPCVPDIGTTAECLASTIVLALEGLVANEARKRKRPEPPARPRPEDPFTRMGSHALSAAMRNHDGPVAARLAFAQLAERRRRLRAFRHKAEPIFDARACALTFEEYAAMPISRLAVHYTDTALDAARAAARAALLLQAHLPAQSGDAVALAPLRSLFDTGYARDSAEQCSHATLVRLAGPAAVSRADNACKHALTCFAKNRRSAMSRAVELLGPEVTTDAINARTVLEVAGGDAVLCGAIIAAIDRTRPLQSRRPGTTSAQLAAVLGAESIAELCGIPCDDATRNVRYVPTGDTDSDSA